MQADIRDIAVLRCAAHWDPHDQYAYEQALWEAFGFLAHVDGNLWSLLMQAYSKQVHCFLSNNKKSNNGNPRPKRYRRQQDMVRYFHIAVTLNMNIYMEQSLLRIFLHEYIRISGYSYI